MKKILKKLANKNGRADGKLILKRNKRGVIINVMDLFENFALGR
jgi:hypothetical protein